MTRLLTIGHGTLAQDEFVALLRGAAIEQLVDVRTAPGSRRHPHFGRDEMAVWLPQAGVAYRWERDLGGFRRPRPDSPNTALRHPAFRGYADHMVTEEFATALDAVLAEATASTTTVMCAESLWWRCHRRLISDFAVLMRGAAVVHLLHDGTLSPHRLTEGVRQDDGLLVYDVGETGSLLVGE